jgi:predicted acylesterase/phospholipase RssA/CRP-like cAMP-binding protein
VETPANSGGGRSAADERQGFLDALAARWASAAVRDGVPAGADLRRDGDRVDALLVVLDGCAECLDGPAPPGSPDTLSGPGEIAGDVPGQSPVQRGTVRALTPVTFVRITGAVLDALPTLAERDLVSAAAATAFRVLRRQMLARLTRVFGPIDDALLADLESRVDWWTLRRGHVLVREGDPADALYVLVTGRLRITRWRPDGAEEAIGEIGPGESVGEMAFFTGEPRSATVRAQRDSVLVRLANDAFEQLIASRPAIMRHVTRLQIERLRRANLGRQPSPVTTFALVPISRGVELGDFAARLTAALGRFGDAMRLSAAEVDRRLRSPGAADSAPDGPDDLRVMTWLGEQEALHRFLVYECDPAAPAWSARAVRQADRVLLVADASADPRPGPDERRVLEGGEAADADVMLALLHRDANRLPTQTRAWLEPRALRSHVHVRTALDADFGRLARLLAGRAIGLALGGGGARSFAHIGVLRALIEAGIPIDMVAGTSMGAAMAAQFAMGWTPDRIVATNREIWIDIEPHKEYTLPVMSLLRSTGADRCGRMLYGDTQLEDLWVRYLCVSSDLTSACMHVHESGSLLRAVTASSSLPGVVVPLLEEGHLLVDGALFNNLPGDLLRERGCGTLVASRVSVEDDQDYSYDRVPSLREVLKARLGRTSLRYPGTMGVVLRAAMLPGIGREGAVSRDADFLFRPDVERFGMMEFTALDAIVTLGYEHAARQIAGWRESGALAASIPDIPSAS